MSTEPTKEYSDWKPYDISDRYKDNYDKIFKKKEEEAEEE